MALVLSDEVTREAQRILAAANSFDVLEILPQDCTPELVQEKHAKKVQLFKRHFRNKTAMLAKARADEAKMKLLQDRLREKETAVFQQRIKTEAQLREEMVQLEQRTRLLELRAELILAKRQPREETMEKNMEKTIEVAHTEERTTTTTTTTTSSVTRTTSTNVEADKNQRGREGEEKGDPASPITAVTTMTTSSGQCEQQQGIEPVCKRPRTEE